MYNDDVMPAMRQQLSHIIRCLSVCLYVDTDTERMSLDVDETNDESIIKSIDRLSGACFMRSV